MQYSMLKYFMIAAISKFFKTVNRLSNKMSKDGKKSEIKTIRFLTGTLNFFKTISKITKSKPVPFGMPALFTDKKIPRIMKTLCLKEEKLKCRIMISDYAREETGDDLIIFFHGSARDQTQWLDKDGFGSMYREVFKNNPSNLMPVVSVSFGMSYIFKNGLPFPYDADLENILMNKIIPYLKNKTGRHGNIHLIGHSIGAFSAFNLAFKYPDTFKTVFAISPFLVKDNPFADDFKYFENAQNTNPSWANMVKYNLRYAFKDTDDWTANNPFSLAVKCGEKNRPNIIITQSKEELEGFKENIEAFIKMLSDNKYCFSYFMTEGDHHHSNITCAYYQLLKIIRKAE